MDPAIPVGSLTAFPTLVQTGTKPQLTWQIVHPEVVQDVVDIKPPGTLTPRQTLDMEVRVIGASVKRVWTNSQGRVTKWEWVPTQGLISYDNSYYSQIFFDTQDSVKPNKVVHKQVVAAGKPINFGGRYKVDYTWSSLFTSTNGTSNVVALANGDTPPTTTPLYQQPTLESFLLPYLDSQGKIKIGPKDVIYLMELTHTDKNNAGFDLQDLVLLVTFKSKGNNGHGNNVDGVDSSNPGNAPFIDSDPSVDDES